ncbi:DinB family protein [Brevibacillus brevis]|uniref:DinB family protein n=1 Tax=Brevibacillus brevis TaxID=1393 RepID=UPI0021BDA5A3|nr:DinB family protein [Brevibacillus brevis]
MFRYQEDKWSVKEVLGHIMDTERIMCYRLLCAFRGDILGHAAHHLHVFQERYLSHLSQI